MQGALQTHGALRACLQIRLHTNTHPYTKHFPHPYAEEQSQKLPT